MSTAHTTASGSVSKAEFARRHNITKGYVTQLIDRGRIPPLAINEDGSLDFKKASAAFKRNVAPRNQERKKKSGGSSFYNIKAEHEQVKKSLSQLALDERIGNLIPKEVVMRLMIRAASECKTKLLAIPANAAVEVVGAGSLEEVKRILKAHIIEALTALAAFNPDEKWDEDPEKKARSSSDRRPHKKPVRKSVKDRGLKPSKSSKRNTLKSKKMKNAGVRAPGGLGKKSVKDRKKKSGRKSAIRKSHK